MAGYIQRVISTFARVVCLAFVVLAGLTIPDVLKLQNGSVNRKGSTLFVPLLVCESSSLNFEGTNGTVAFDTTEDGVTCHSQTNLIWTVVISLCFGMAATLSFFVFGLMAMYKKGPFSKSSVFGMGLFLIFILVQTTACAWALAHEAQYWGNYYESLFVRDPSYGIDHVSMYGSIKLLLSTGGVAIGAAACLLLEAFVALCCCKSNKSDIDSSSSSANQDSIKEVSPPDVMSTTDQQSTHSWTDY